MKKVTTGGGWPAVLYTLRKAREAGGLWKFWKAMRSRNACKTWRQVWEGSGVVW